VTINDSNGVPIIGKGPSPKEVRMGASVGIIQAVLANLNASESMDEPLIVLSNVLAQFIVANNLPTTLLHEFRENTRQAAHALREQLEKEKKEAEEKKPEVVS
jgi:hypothetical protein